MRALRAASPSLNTVTRKGAAVAGRPSSFQAYTAYFAAFAASSITLATASACEM